MKTRFRWATRQRNSLVKTRASLRLERLEPRTVLSGVTCELQAGLLTIHGSEGADAIGLEWDGTGHELQVQVGGRVIQTFCADEIRMVNVVGLQSHDELHVDPNLSLPLALQGAEGEAARNDAEAISNYPAPDAFFQGLSVATAASRLDQVGLLPPAPQVVSEHVHSHHSPVSASSDATRVGPTAPAGQAVAGLVAVGHRHTSSTSIPTAPALADARGERLGNGASHHSAKTLTERAEPVTFDPEGKASTEFVKKWCTTTPWAKQLVASLDGKPVCKCGQTSSLPGSAGWPGEWAESDNALRSAVIDLVFNPTSSLDGRPCQQDAFFALEHELGTGEACSMVRDRSAASDQVALLATAGLPDQPAPISESIWAENLEWIGWSLVAASAALLPLVFDKERKGRLEYTRAAGCAGASRWLGIEKLAYA